MTIHSYGEFKEERRELVLCCAHCRGYSFYVRSDSFITKEYQCWDCKQWSLLPEQNDIVKHFKEKQ